MTHLPSDNVYTASLLMLCTCSEHFMYLLRNLCFKEGLCVSCLIPGGCLVVKGVSIHTRRTREIRWKKKKGEEDSITRPASHSTSPRKLPTCACGAREICRSGKISVFFSGELLHLVRQSLKLKCFRPSSSM